MSEITYNTYKNSADHPVRALVVDDEAAIRGPVGLCLEALGYQITEAATADDALRAVSEYPLDVALLDVRLGTANGIDLIPKFLAHQPQIKIIVITAYGSIDLAVRAMSRGATDFLTKPFTPEQITAVVARAVDLLKLESQVATVADIRGTAGPEADFASTSQAVQQAMSTARQVASTDIPVLIGGESGTGKSVLARAIHGWGTRAEKRFAVIDCAVNSPAFVELTLFGDAVSAEQMVTADKPALLLAAGDGTLLLRHVDALSARSQERLARVINTRELESAGRSAAQPVAARIMATLAGTQPKMIPALQQALDRIHLVLPPLRERRDDIPQLAQRYLSASRRHANKQVMGISQEAVDHLLAYDWPGNLRELHVVIEGAVRVTDTQHVEVRHLPTIFSKTVGERPRAGDPVSVKNLEAAHIRATIENTSSLQEAADVLGLDLQALYRRRKQFGID